MVTTPHPIEQKQARTRPALLNFLSGQRMRENITGWLYIAPAMLLTTIFGLFPIAYAFYMSLYRWRLSQGRFQCMDGDTFSIAGCLANYTSIIGDYYGLLLFVLGLLILVGAYWLWAGDKHYFERPLNRLNFRDALIRSTLPILLIVAAFLYGIQATRSEVLASEALIEPRLPSRLTENTLAAWEASNQSQVAFDALALCNNTEASSDEILACLNDAVSRTATDGYVLYASGAVAIAIAVWLALFAHRSGLSKRPRHQDWKDGAVKATLSLLITGISFYLVAAGYALMLDTGNEEFIRGLPLTLYYALGSVPIQLGLGMILAYVLFQKIWGKQFFRMLFFLPYITPAVAAAVIFKLVFNPREGLANGLLETLGLQSQPWIHGNQPFLNQFFGLNIDGFLAGPSMAMVSIIALGIWTYTGYNAVIFLAGLGQIPEDLYEAARVDGANDWHLFRFITFPLLSPITFYLSVLAFIGTFKAFNHIYVMRTPFAQGTVDTASLVIFDTFKADFQYGLATAQAILLFLVILGLTQVQRTFFEKKVFYS